jgi:hypothetical protein
MVATALAGCGARSELGIGDGVDRGAGGSSASTASTSNASSASTGAGGSSVVKCPADLDYFIEVFGDGEPQRYTRAFVLNDVPTPEYPDSPHTNGPAAAQYARGPLMEIGACDEPPPDHSALRFGGYLGVCGDCDGTSQRGPTFYDDRNGAYLWTYTETSVTLFDWAAFKQSYNPDAENVLEGNYIAHVADDVGRMLTLQGEFRVCLIPSQPVF